MDIASFHRQKNREAQVRSREMAVSRRVSADCGALGHPFRRGARSVFDFDDKLQVSIRAVHCHIGTSHCLNLRRVARSELTMITLIEILSHQRWKRDD